MADANAPPIPSLKLPPPTAPPHGPHPTPGPILRRPPHPNGATPQELVRLDSGDVHDEAEKLRLSAKRAGLELPDAEELEQRVDSAAKYEDRVSDFMDKNLFRPK